MTPSRRPALVVDGFELEPHELLAEAPHAPHDRRPPPRRRRRRRRRGRQLRRRPPARVHRRRAADLPASTRSTRSRRSSPTSRATGPGGSSRAALDLALRQAGRSLADALGREPQPVTFVVSQSAESGSCCAPLPRAPLQARRERLRGRTRSSPSSPRPAPSTSSTSRACTRATGSTRRRPRSSTAASPRAFPTRGSRTPGSTTRRGPCSSRTADRLTWDSPIHSVADVEALPFRAATASTRSRRASAPSGGCSTSTTTAPRTGDRALRRRPVRARAGSRPDPAPRRRSSTRTRRTTSRRRSTTSGGPRPGLPTEPTRGARPARAGLPRRVATPAS